MLTPRKFLFPVSVLAIFFLAQLRTDACSCLARPVDQKLAESPVVFQGRVTKATPLTTQAGVDLVVRYTFDVSRVWKGASVRTIDVSAGTSSAACGMTFDVGQEYVIYVNGSDQGYSTNLCAGNFQTGQEYATTEIAELDRLVGNSYVGSDPPVVDGVRPIVVGIDFGYLSVHNDEGQFGISPGIWGRYDFTSRSFVRVRFAYASLDTTMSSAESFAVGPAFYHGALEGGLRLVSRNAVSLYVVFGAVVSSTTAVRPEVTSSGESEASLFSTAPVLGIGVEHSLGDRLIIFVEASGALNLGGNLPSQAFGSMLGIRTGVGWRF